MRRPGRNHQLIRQWRILLRLATARVATSYYALAADHGVSSRTVRRDLAALQEAGFPIVDEIVDDDTGTVGWRLMESRDVSRLMSAQMGGR